MVVYDVTLYPCPIVAVRNVVFIFVGHAAGAASYTAGNVDDKGKISFGEDPFLGPHAENLLRNIQGPGRNYHEQGAGNCAI
jgi:hypothetical protein